MCQEQGKIPGEWLLLGHGLDVMVLSIGMVLWPEGCFSHDRTIYNVRMVSLHIWMRSLTQLDNKI